MEVYYFYSNYVFDDGNWKSESVNVEEGRFIRTLSNKRSTLEMDVSNLWIGPGKVYLDTEDPLYAQLDYENVVNKYIYRGCTLLICQMPVKNKSTYRNDFMKFKRNLTSLAVDYMIAPRIPAGTLQPDHVRYFARKKVPFLLVEAFTNEELINVKWQWIKDAQSLTGIPLVLTTNEATRTKKDKLQLWKKLCAEFDIKTIDDEISDYPLSKKVLRTTGISPYKGEIVQHGCADYNLFENDKTGFIDEDTKFRYHKAIPVITVLNGDIIKTNHLVHANAGLGIYRQVSIPQHFVFS